MLSSVARQDMAVSEGAVCPDWSHATSLRWRSRLGEATFAERQRILRLLIEGVMVGEDSLEIRHVIPLGHEAGNSLGQGPEEPASPGDGRGGEPEETPGHRPSCRLRSDGVRPARLAIRGPSVGRVAVASWHQSDRLANESVQRLGPSRRLDPKRRGLDGHRHPEPGLLSLLLPAGLINPSPGAEPIWCSIRSTGVASDSESIRWALENMPLEIATPSRSLRKAAVRRLLGR